MILFDDHIDKDSIKEFSNELESKIKELNKKEILDVYLSTTGGYPCYVSILINKLVKYKSKIKIFLLDSMNSSGFDLLWYLKDFEIYMLPSFRLSVAHKMAISVSTSLPEYDIYIKQIYNDTLLWASRLAELGVSDTDIARFIKGEDLLFSREDILKLFSNIKEYEL